jgi:Tfp pilus assembly protein PilE
MRTTQGQGRGALLVLRCLASGAQMTKTTTKNQNSAFTLVEIIVVLITIGVITALAIPKYTTTVERFRAKEGEQILMSALGSQKRFFIENRSYMMNPQNLDIDTPSTYFSSVAIDSTAVSPGYPLAAINRLQDTVTLYRLRIFANAQIRCDTDGGTGLCSKIGY